MFRNKSHNHEITNENSHSVLKKLIMTFDIQSFIATQFKAQTIFFQIMIFLRFQNDDYILEKKNIYNAKTMIRRKTLSFFIFMQYFFQYLNRNN